MLEDVERQDPGRLAEATWSLRPGCGAALHTEPVRLLYPYYAGTLQKAALDLVARKVSASLQVDGHSLAGALEAAGALTDEDRLHATAALAIGQALYRAAAQPQ